MNNFNFPLNVRFYQILAILTVLVMVFSSVGTVAAQSDPNMARWDEQSWVDQFVTGSINAPFSSANPLPAPEKLPQDIKDALTHGMVMVLIEPWRVGCPTPLTDPNCNVGYVKSFADYTKLYKTVYEKSEANKGNFGPWTDGSVHMTRLPEVAAALATEEEWTMFVNGSLKITFAENQPLPVQDPTNGTRSFKLVEPWRHTCVGLSTDPNCNVGDSGDFVDWKSMLDYLSQGAWTRGSVITLPKQQAAIGGNLPTPGAVVSTVVPGQNDVTSPIILGTPQVATTPDPRMMAVYEGTFQVSERQLLWGLIILIGIIALIGLFRRPAPPVNVTIDNDDDDDKPKG